MGRKRGEKEEKRLKLEKRRENRERERKSGTKVENCRKVLSLLPLLTDRVGYATTSINISRGQNSIKH